MAKYSYHLQVQRPGGEWISVSGRGEGLSFNLGRIAERREFHPGPRLAVRCVRSDGRVMDEAPAIERAHMGAGAGFPPPVAYARAALGALERGGLNGDATDAVRKLIAELVAEDR